MKSLLTLAALAVTFAAPAQAKRLSPDAQLADLLKGRVAGAPVQCIPTNVTNSQQIVTGRAIVWRVGSKLYVNVPRARAETLRDDDVLITQQWGSQLCRNDQVRTVNPMSRIPGGVLLLGDFVPYTKPAGG